MKLLGHILIYIGLFFVYTGATHGYGFSATGALMGLALAMPFWLIGKLLVDRQEQKDQETRDDAAATNPDAIDVSSEHPDLSSNNAEEPSAPVCPPCSNFATATPDRFFLYLRPFESTNAYRINDASANIFSGELWERDGYDDIERLIARALVPTAPFLGFGQPGEHRGAARIKAKEEDWQPQVRELIDKALRIIVIPSSNAGTLWEMEVLLKCNHIRKTIFVMPPSDGLVYSSGRADPAEDWRHAKSACSELGIELPDMRPAGAIFKMIPSMGTFRMEQLPSADPRQWARAFQKIINH